MHFFVHYFIDSSIKDYKKIVDKLSRNKLLKKIYIVCFVNNSDLMEIYDSYVLKQKYFRSQKIEICALCSCEETAFEFIRQLSEISVRKYNDFFPRKCLEEIKEGEISI